MDRLIEKMLDPTTSALLEEKAFIKESRVLFLRFSDMKFPVERFYCSRINYVNYDV